MGKHTIAAVRRLASAISDIADAIREIDPGKTVLHEDVTTKIEWARKQLDAAEVWEK